MPEHAPQLGIMLMVMREYMYVLQILFNITDSIAKKLTRKRCKFNIKASSDIKLKKVFKVNMEKHIKSKKGRY